MLEPTNNEPNLKPVEEPIELALTPSLQPTITHPIEKPICRELPMLKETHEPSTSQVKESPSFNEMSWGN